ncbi:hypothetical protein REC12_00055 [Desulfosporosinus sp. PR]|uniref:hypothetical protein n=1 Tax=Candidatus Desulfosporosinus nitrosoreducens TaxID=3401928 RepID=UPI0027FBD062|nr:hypothetical protein [Desulfosporosinus sp. PR]MDQ7091987.1 hypothetical protein [Desulfosporosinus sp. PR]
MIKLTEGIYIEENGAYQLDCSAALWSTDQIYKLFHSAGTFLSDADFVAETAEFLVLIEYKNANIPDAANPKGFNPSSPKKIDNIARKFYDSLHYLSLETKNKPVRYVYIVEYPNAGVTDRKMLRNVIANRLPFKMQLGKPGKLIDNFEVLSISEWNTHVDYSAFPLTPVMHGEAS